MAESKPLLDMSLGDPALPLRSVANYAFRAAQNDLNHYQTQAPGYTGSGPAVRNILEPVRDYFTRRGLHDPDWSGLATDQILVSGGGTTQIFSWIMQAQAAEVAKQNEYRETKVKPAILMPVPTYGLFFKPAQDAGIEIIKIERDLARNGALDPDAVLNAVRDAHKKGFRIVSWFDSNPNNPFGTIRGREETEGLARIFTALNHHYEERDIKDKGVRSSSFLSRVKIIDDMVYDGLEYDGMEKGYPFARIPELFDDTFTLFGPSKAGLVGLRAGLVIGNGKTLRPLRDLAMRDSYFPPTPALHALAGFYNDDEKLAAGRNAHLKKLNETHRKQGILMKALINGVDAMPESEASKSDRAWMKNVLVRDCGLTPEAASRKLKNGIDGVDVITTPQSGFFHLLDFSAQIGRDYARGPHRQTAEVEDEWAIDRIFRQEHGIHFAFGSWAGLPVERMVVRATFAAPPATILDFTRRLKAGMGHFCEPPKFQVSGIRAAPAP